MISANKILNYQDRIVGDRRPITADVFLTDYCNSKCGYCRYGQRSGAYISVEKFDIYAEKLVKWGVRGIILTGGGEPTINPDFDEICSLLQHNCVPYGLNTNGIVYKKNNARFVKVSIDEGDEEQYKAVRGVDKLPEVLENVKRYCEDRRESHSRVGVQCVVRDATQILEFYERVSTLDVDYIQFRPIELPSVMEHEEYVRLLWVLEGLRKNDERVYISYKFDHLELPTSCPAHWAAVCVKVNGDIPVCCQRADEIIGNIEDDDIQDKYSRYIVREMGRCEHPCRLTGANIALANNKVTDIAFI